MVKSPCWQSSTRRVDESQVPEAMGAGEMGRRERLGSTRNREAGGAKKIGKAAYSPEPVGAELYAA